MSIAIAIGEGEDEDEDKDERLSVVSVGISSLLVLKCLGTFAGSLHYLIVLRTIKCQSKAAGFRIQQPKNRSIVEALPLRCGLCCTGPTR